MGLWDSFLSRFRAAYELEDLLRARAEVLGKGRYGTMFKASMDSGVAVAVKRLKPAVVSEDDFKAKVEDIGSLDHENLVALRAYFASSDERLLIYDYFPHGSLFSALHRNNEGRESLLGWEARVMIALGTARGVGYIHSQGPTTYHGNIKSSNILLFKNYEARVSDYDLAQLGITLTHNHYDGYYYCAPEVRDADDSNNVSYKAADVYSFGVVLLEILTGKDPTKKVDDMMIPSWVQSVARDDHEWSSDVFDAELLNQYSKVPREMVRVLELAVDCTDVNPDRRPTMVDVAARIEQIFGFTSLKQDVTSNVTAPKRFRKLRIASV